MTENRRDVESESTPIPNTDNAGREKTWVEIGSESRCYCSGCACSTTNP